MSSSTQQVSALQRAVLRAYELAGARRAGPVGAGTAYAFDDRARRAATLAQFVRCAREVADAGMLERSGHESIPLYRLTDAGREAIADG